MLRTVNTRILAAWCQTAVLVGVILLSVVACDWAQDTPRSTTTITRI
jgi:hypothetical protein